MPPRQSQINAGLKVSVTQLCPTLCDPMDCSPPGSSVHGVLQARILEWVAISFSRGSSWPRDWTWVSRIAGRFFNHLSHQEAPITSLRGSNKINSHMNSSQIFKNKLKKKPTMDYSRVCMCMLSHAQPSGLQPPGSSALGISQAKLIPWQTDQFESKTTEIWLEGPSFSS